MKGNRYVKDRKRHCKDYYFEPKNVFLPKHTREYYRERTTIKLPERLIPHLENIYKQPLKLVIPEEYAFECDSHHNNDFSNFIRSIVPRRRTTNDHYIYLVKKKPNNLNFKGNYRIHQSNYKKVLDIIFEAIERETL